MLNELRDADYRVWSKRFELYFNEPGYFNDFSAIRSVGHNIAEYPDFDILKDPEYSKKDWECRIPRPNETKPVSLAPRLTKKERDNVTKRRKKSKKRYGKE